MGHGNTMRSYAPAWAVLMGAATAIAKQTGTRYVMEREWKLKPSDIIVALAVSVLSYVTYRMRYGRKNERSWYKR